MQRRATLKVVVGRRLVVVHLLAAEDESLRGSRSAVSSLRRPAAFSLGNAAAVRSTGSTLLAGDNGTGAGIHAAEPRGRGAPGFGGVDAGSGSAPRHKQGRGTCCGGGMPSFSSTRSLMRLTVSVGSMSNSISLPAPRSKDQGWPRPQRPRSPARAHASARRRVCPAARGAALPGTPPAPGGSAAEPTPMQRPRPPAARRARTARWSPRANPEAVGASRACRAKTSAGRAGRRRRGPSRRPGRGRAGGAGGAGSPVSVLTLICIALRHLSTQSTAQLSSCPALPGGSTN